MAVMVKIVVIKCTPTPTRKKTHVGYLKIMILLFIVVFPTCESLFINSTRK